ncbi:NUDIX domain-containing protein [Streptomyces sp. NPDC050161]|uniref:NUDIX domain-containing protein n=1 Tax=Streptomyces sp. NPDC050161 TaxID=3365604 RepID=UPI0037AD643E
MTPTRSAIRALVDSYLDRHPNERPALVPLLTALDAPADPTSRATLPAHLTCSAVVIDRDRRVLHIRHRASGGLMLTPGGHVEPGDATLLAAAVRETGIRPGDLCLTPQLRDAPLDIDVHDIDANPAKHEPAHRHYDVKFAFHLARETVPEIVVQDDEVAGAEWRRFEDIGSPILRTKLLNSDLDGRPQPMNASALIHDGAGRYLLHLRDNYPGIWEPGAWALLGGGREPQDHSLLDTIRRELAEEAPGIGPLDLEPFAVDEATGTEGLCVPVQIYACQWCGDADRVGLTEGVMVRWFAPEMLHRLVLSESTRELVLRHAADHGAGTSGTGHRPDAPLGVPVAESAAGAAATIRRLAQRFTAHDEARGLSAPEQWTLQVLKLAEETGEAAQAIIGARGTNPRKPTASWDDVHAEVADVAVTALVSLARMRPGDAEQYLHQQLALKAAPFLPDGIVRQP